MAAVGFDRAGRDRRRRAEPCFHFFNNGEGIRSVAAALEDESYPRSTISYSTLRTCAPGIASPQDESPYGGRLGALCQQVYERADQPGYLEMGVPVNYGAGASEVVREIIEHGGIPPEAADRIAASRRHRTRARGMAKPGAAHRAGAGLPACAVAGAEGRLRKIRGRRIRERNARNCPYCSRRKPSRREGRKPM